MVYYNRIHLSMGFLATAWIKKTSYLIKYLLCKSSYLYTYRLIFWALYVESLGVLARRAQCKAIWRHDISVAWVRNPASEEQKSCFRKFTYLTLFGWFLDELYNILHTYISWIHFNYNCVQSQTSYSLDTFSRIKVAVTSRPHNYRHRI